MTRQCSRHWILSSKGQQRLKEDGRSWREPNVNSAIAPAYCLPRAAKCYCEEGELLQRAEHTWDCRRQEFQGQGIRQERAAERDRDLQKMRGEYRDPQRSLLNFQLMRDYDCGKPSQRIDRLVLGTFPWWGTPLFPPTSTENLITHEALSTAPRKNLPPQGQN